MKMSDREYELYVEKKHARSEGRAEGRTEERREMATAMLAEGDSVEKVMRISKLTEAEVRAIKASLEH
jgi:predicted transposase YdaD